MAGRGWVPTLRRPCAKRASPVALNGVAGWLSGPLGSARSAAPQGARRSIRQPPDLRDIGWSERAQAAALYLGLVFVLGVMTWELHETLTAAGQGRPPA